MSASRATNSPEETGRAAWGAKDTYYYAFVMDDLEPDTHIRIEAHDVDFTGPWLRIETSSDYAEGDASAPAVLFYPSHRVFVVEQVKKRPF